MKNIKIGLWVIVLALVCVFFAACDATAVDIKNTYVNDDMHLIVEYTDGTTKDLGYVGVEVEVEKEVFPPKYTVTFLDAFGAMLKTEKVYKGDAATAPVAPEIANKSFDRWDTAFDTVMGDLTIRPVYVAAAEYTVTFLDENGATIKTEKVVHGHAATAPTAPLRADTIFKEWDTAFDNVKSDLTVRAVYRAKNTYTVTFKDYSGLVLGTASVKETDTATAPVTPTRDGYTFSGWSSALTNITENKTVTAKYTLKSGQNIFDIAYMLNENGTVTVKVSVVGSVCFVGMEGEMALPTGISGATLTALGETTANIDGGKVLFTYTSATNITKSVELFSLTFTPSSDTVAFGLVISDIYDQNYDTVSYKVIGESVKVK